MLKKSTKIMAVFSAAIMLFANFAVCANAMSAQSLNTIKSRVPLKAYTLDEGRVTTYKSINGSKSGYIDGSVDLCTIKEIYDEWVRVEYPVPGGTKTAYCRLSDFIYDMNYTVQEAEMTSGQKAYRRYSGNETIGSADRNDVVYVVSEHNGRSEIIYPLTGSKGYKLGWVPSSSYRVESQTTTAATTTYKPTAGGVSYYNKTPIKARTISTENVTTYKSVNGAPSGYISGNKDLCTILEIYTDGWVKVNYPLSGGGTKTAYCRLSDFVKNTGYSTWKITAPAAAKAYIYDRGSSDIGFVDSGDELIVVSESNGRYQVVYPINGGHKLGWVDISATTTTQPFNTTTVATTTAADNDSQKPAMKATTTVRCGPSGSYASCGKVFTSDEIEVLRYENNYYEIEYSTASRKKRGYVPASSVKNAGNAATASNAGTVAYMTSASKTYTGPSESVYEKSGSVSDGEQVSILRSEGNWYQIEYGTDSGSKRAYVPQNIVTTVKPSAPDSSEYSGSVYNYYSNGWNVTQSFNSTSGKYRGHIGVDLTGHKEIYAVMDGTVVASAKYGANGNTVTIRHTVNGVTFYSFYAHMSSRKVEKNEQVKAGQVIGYIGSSGTGTGIHLHLGIYTGTMIANQFGYYRNSSGTGVSFDSSNGYVDFSGCRFYDPERFFSSNGSLIPNVSFSSSIETDDVKTYESCTYSISSNGVNFIKKWEGFRSTPYTCPSGKLTIGYGHVIKAGENYSSLTEKEAVELLRSDVSGIYTDKLNKFLYNNSITVTQAQYDALLSFTYNCGENTWGSIDFTLKRLLLQYRDGSKIPPDLVRDAFGRWNRGGGKVLQGLVKRRAEEAEMFIKG